MRSLIGRTPLKHRRPVHMTFGQNEKVELLFDIGYVSFTCRHLHQRIQEHKRSDIGKHPEQKHNLAEKNVKKKTTLSHLPGVFLFLFLFFYIKELKPELTPNRIQSI